MINLPSYESEEVICLDHFLALLDSGEIVIAEKDNQHILYYKNGDNYIAKIEENDEKIYTQENVEEHVCDELENGTKMYVNMGATFGKMDESTYDIVIHYLDDNTDGYPYCVCEQYHLRNEDGTLKIGDLITFPSYKLAYGFAFPLHQMKNLRMIDYVPEEKRKLV